MIFGFIILSLLGLGLEVVALVLINVLFVVVALLPETLILIFRLGAGLGRIGIVEAGALTTSGFADASPAAFAAGEGDWF